MGLLALVLLGVIGFMRLPLTYLPSAQASRLFVRVDITRTSPEVLERELVRPLEEAVAGLRGVQRMQIGSGGWGVRLNLEFEPGVDADGSKLELRDRIDRVRGELPDFVQNVEIGSYSDADDPVMEVRLSSNVDLAGSYELIDERIVRRIERIDGVARVELEGAMPREIDVAVDLEAVERNGVSLAEIGTAVRDARQGRSLGEVRQATVDTGVRSPSAVASESVIAALPVRRAADDGVTAVAPLTTGAVGVVEGRPDARFASLGELAKIREQPEELRSGKRLNGRKAVNLEVFVAAGASVVDVTTNVRETVAEMTDDPALDGVEVLVVRDSGAVILRTLADMRDTGIYGGILAVIVLFGFLHRARITLAAALSVPLSVLATGAVLFVQGEELSCVVLLGLVLGVGMLIDNAVVIVEAIAVHTREGHPPLEAARMGARDVGFATIASTASTVIVFVPLLVNDPADEMSTYLRPLGVTLSICLIASLVVSQTSVPLLMAKLLPASSRPTRHPVLDGLASGYRRVVGFTIRWPKLTLLLGLALASSSVWPSMQLPIKLGRADVKPDHLPIRLEFTGSRGFAKIEGHIIVLEESLLASKDELGIESVSCSYGDHRSSCRVYPAIAFEDEKELLQFQARITAELPQQVGVRYRVNESEMGHRENTDRNVVEFAIKGDNMATLMQLAEQVADHLEANLVAGDPSNPEGGGYDMVTTPYTDGAREIHVVLDGPRVRALGLAPNAIAERVSLAFQGTPLGSAHGEHGELEIRLSALGDDQTKPGLDDIRDLRVPLPQGGEIPLGAIASLEFERRPFWIQRVDRQTEVRLQVRFFDEAPKENYALVVEAMSGFGMPTGYSWGRGTSWRTEAEASSDMLINLGLCLLLVYAVMASLFESFAQPAGILLTCILGAFGAPWAMWATGTTLDATAIVGLFLLVGVVVNNGIMLVDRVTVLRASGVPRSAALRQAGHDRLRPILMTVATTVLGLVPMLIHHPTLAGVYYHAIAIVVAGGLTTSTLITLIFLPAVYVFIEDTSDAMRRGWARVWGFRR